MALVHAGYELELRKGRENGGPPQVNWRRRWAVAPQRLPVSGVGPGLGTSAVAVMPLLAFCGTQDVAGYSTLCDSYTGGPVVSLCDNYPGGVGVTEFAYERIDELLELARRTIAECQCEDGCPACVQAPNCGSNNDPLDKLGALDVIDLCLGREPAPIASPTPPEAGRPPER